jgi:hypothetical protein
VSGIVHREAAPGPHERSRLLDTVERRVCQPHRGYEQEALTTSFYSDVHGHASIISVASKTVAKLPCWWCNCKLLFSAPPSSRRVRDTVETCSRPGGDTVETCSGYKFNAQMCKHRVAHTPCVYRLLRTSICLGLRAPANFAEGKGPVEAEVPISILLGMWPQCARKSFSPVPIDQ